MKVGDVRLFERGRKAALVAAFGIWAEREGKYIHIHMTGDGENFVHTTVTYNPESVRYHKTLFRDLRRLLIAHDRWPFGDEGAETEE
jgi:hypothetical protein